MPGIFLFRLPEKVRMAEKRHFSRVSAALKCRFEVDGDDHEGIIINISSQGIGTTSDAPIEVGVKKQLHFPPTNMTVPARVCWCQAEGEHYTVGWLFQESAPEILLITQQLQKLWEQLG